MIAKSDGFVLSGIAEATGVVIEETDVLQHIAHLGVLLLLFTVGLKLKLRSIVSPEVIGGSLLHFGITCAVFTPGVYLLMDLDWSTALMLAARYGHPKVLGALLGADEFGIATFHHPRFQRRQ